MTPDQWADKALEAFAAHGHELNTLQRQHLHAAVSQAVEDAITANNVYILEQVTAQIGNRAA